MDASPGGRFLNPKLRERICGKVDPFDQEFIASIFAIPPDKIATRLVAEWERCLETEGRRASNQYALRVKEEVIPELFCDTALSFDATKDQIAWAAMRAARSVRNHLPTCASPEQARALLKRVADSYSVPLPRCDAVDKTIHRMTDPAWWRRELRKRYVRVERAAIKAGLVHTRAAPFISEEAMRRFESHEKSNRTLIDAMEAVNEETGEVLALADIVNSSLANPANRRAALMSVIRGLEVYERGRGRAGLLLTITCPSRMHARRSSDGEPNLVYDGTSPTKAQHYLCRLWNTVSRKLAREGIDCSGLRVVEPHHDATPHWHILAFVKAEHVVRFSKILRDYVLRDSPNEPGASRHRFVVEAIDPYKSAIGYIAKYISKNIDGVGVGLDDEAKKPAGGSAQRAVAWARTHGIRQFQFFGAPSLTQFRELYRLDALPITAHVLQGAWQGAKENDFAAYLTAIRDGTLRLKIMYEDRFSARYPGELASRICGLTVYAGAGEFSLTTRTAKWRIQESAKSKEARLENSNILLARHITSRHWVPWTRFNNSARVDSAGDFSPLSESDVGQYRGAAKPSGRERRRAALTKLLIYRMREPGRVSEQKADRVQPTREFPCS